MKRWVQRTLPAAAGLILVLAIAGQSARAESASTWFKRGQSAEARDDADAAYEAYLKAYKQKPEDLRYKTALYRIRVSASGAHVHRGEKLSAQGDFTGALTEFLHALEIDPGNELAQQDIDATRRKLSAQPSGESSLPRTGPEGLSDAASPIELKPVSNEPLTLHMVEDSKIVYQTIGKAAGINVLFDPEYTSKRIPIDLSNVSLYDALRIMGTISNTFWRPVTSNTIFVAQNTRAKRTELDEQAVQTFYLTNAAQQNDLNDIQTAVRNVLSSGSAKLYGVPSQNAIVMRATPDELLLAQKLISDLDKARPEVIVDVAVMEVSREKMRNIGIQLPQTATVQIQGNSTSTTSTPGTTPGATPAVAATNLTLNTLAHLNATNFAVTVGQAQANLLLSDTSTRILQNPRIRATDNQKASMKVGSRIPIATGSFSNGIGAGGIGGIGAVQTQFQYLDVGVNVDITPTVHYDRDVTLKLKIEVSSHSGDTTISGVTEPIISQRTVEQVIRLKEGEANIIGGILTKQDNRVLSGTPGLSEVPLLKYLFGSNSRDVTDDEIVFLLIPHVVRATQLSDLNLRTIDTGTGSSVDIRHEPAPAKSAGTIQIPAAPGPNPPSGQALPSAAPAPSQPQAGLAPVTLQLTPAQSAQKTGSSFQVAVNLSGGQDVFSVPLQVQYDAGRLSLINVDGGDFLGRDGQAVALVHRDDGAGGVTISASRPPGAGGISGAGAVCILTFQAKQPGDATISITRPAARNSAQQAIPASGSQAVVHVQ